jgi:hypothetical protein
VNTPSATSPLSFGEVAVPLHDRGWCPLPVSGKAPVMAGWNNLCHMPWDRTDLVDATADYVDCSCGIAATEDLVFIDGDILDPDLATDVATIADAIFRPTPLVRVGRAPKWVRIYRRDPASSIRSRKTHPIEVMSGSGQIVAFGFHPSTSEPYRWIGKHSPLTLSANSTEIPLVSNKQLDQFLSAAHSILWRAHYGVGAGAHRHPAQPPPDIHQQLRQLALRVGFERAAIELLEHAIEGTRHMTMWAVVSSAAGRGYHEGRLVQLFQRHFVGWSGVSREAFEHALDQTYRREITDV